LISHILFKASLGCIITPMTANIRAPTPIIVAKIRPQTSMQPRTSHQARAAACGRKPSSYSLLRSRVLSRVQSAILHRRPVEFSHTRPDDRGFYPKRLGSWIAARSGDCLTFGSLLPILVCLTHTHTPSIVPPPQRRTKPAFRGIGATLVRTCVVGLRDRKDCHLLPAKEYQRSSRLVMPPSVGAQKLSPLR
jgi:hypothetical protein